MKHSAFFLPSMDILIQECILMVASYSQGPRGPWIKSSPLKTQWFYVSDPAKMMKSKRIAPSQKEISSHNSYCFASNSMILGIYGVLIVTNLLKAGF